MWSHNEWQASFFGRGTKTSQRLEKYAQVFNTVEGNTTFYATPASSTVANWHSATPDNFRFTFKLPSAITHQHQLVNCQEALSDFLRVMSPLHEKVGMWTIQLPAQFSPEQLSNLMAFCQWFPKDFPLGIEVRHLAFFDKGENEKRLNHWLVETGIDRIIMDSRPVFAAKPDTPAVIEAHSQKPRVPTHAIATAEQPMIRFIGHPDLEANSTFFAPWLKTIPQWIEQGKTPYIMVHTPDNNLAPQLAKQLYQQLQQLTTLPALARFPAEDDDGQQLAMF
ncbi:DUF72 domain-containing protein [Vibrio hippocampi]|nr:DUF72 domain-containing protein [Vibrio hippocampi]